MPAVDLARISAAFAGLAASLDRWPWARSTNACLHIYSEDAEWLLDCADHVPDGFAPTEQSFAESVIYGGSSPVTFYGTKVPYKALVAAKPATVSFYQPTIAESKMFIDRPWYVAASLDSLVADHPAFSEDMTSEEWLGILVHEFFHLSQLSHPTVSRFLETHQEAFLKNPGARLQKTFADDADFAKAVSREFEPLRRAVAKGEALTARAAKRALRTWLQRHRARQKKFARVLQWSELALWEDFELFLEGLARLVEDRYRTDRELHAGALSLLARDSRFHRFEASAGQLYSTPSYGKMRAPTWFYEMGAHLGRVLDVASPGWRATVLDDDGLLVGAVERAIR